MVEKPPIMVLDEPEGAEDNCGDDAEIIGLELDIFGEPVHFRVGVVERQARLADIVPAARALSTKLALAMLSRLGKDGKFVPCRKGCSACCSYLIPLSVPEVFRLRQEVLAMPAEHSSPTLKSCLGTARKILDNVRDNLVINDPTKIDGQIQISRLSKWYSGLKRFCPFWSNGLCTIYEQHPIACREHIVTGSALSCGTERTDESQVVRMPVSIIECLCQLAAELE